MLYPAQRQHENVSRVNGHLASTSSVLRSSTFWQIPHQEKLPNSHKKVTEFQTDILTFPLKRTVTLLIALI